MLFGGGGRLGWGVRVGGKRGEGGSGFCVGGLDGGVGVGGLGVWRFGVWSLENLGVLGAGSGIPKELDVWMIYFLQSFFFLSILRGFPTFVRGLNFFFLPVRLTLSSTSVNSLI